MTDIAITAIQQYFALETKVGPHKTELRDFVRRLANQERDLLDEFASGLKIAEAMFGPPEQPKLKPGPKPGSRRGGKTEPEPGKVPGK